METISERASAEDWTCEVLLEGNRLPDLNRLVDHLTEMRVGATLRGVEAAVEGELRREGGLLYLDLPGTGERLRLAPLTRVVQWHVARDRERRITRSERAAFRRLARDEARGSLRAVRVVGTLVASKEEGPYLLEVRRFARLRAVPPREHTLSSIRMPDHGQGD